MILGVTGHRKMIHDDLTVTQAIKTQLLFRQPETVITGVAIGYDTVVALACIDLNIPFIAAIPFEGQHLKWSTTQQITYSYIISRAKEAIWTDNEGYAAWKYIKRDKWIVEHSDSILAYYDHRKEGGTFETIKYAIKQSKEVINIYEQLQNAVSRV